MNKRQCELQARLRRSAIAGVLVFVALVLQPAAAQTNAPPEVFVLGTPAMQPDGQGSAHVYTSESRPLRSADFVVRFGGQPATGVNVQPDDSVPLQVVLGLDVSLWNPYDVEHTSALTRTVLAAKTFVENIPNASFSAFPFSMTLPSAERNDLSWLQSPRLWQGNRTALFAAVDAAARQLARADTMKGRKVIVLITNSGNTLNTSAPARGAWANSLNEAIANAGRANAQVFVFAAEEKLHPLSPLRRTELRTLVEATGGEFISTTVASRLPDLVANTLADLRVGYRVDFTSTVPVSVPSALEVGLTQSTLSSVSIAAQSPLTASLGGISKTISPNEVVTLNMDQAWAKDIRSVEVFLDGKSVITLPPSQLAFKWGDPNIKERIRELTPGTPAVLMAKVQHRLNSVVEMTRTVTVPALPPLTMTVSSVAGQRLTTGQTTLYTDEAFTLTAHGKDISNFTFVITDAQGVASQRAGDVLELAGAFLPPGDYTLQARALDEWGRPVQSDPFTLNVAYRFPPILILLLLLFMVALIALWLAMLQRRRAAGRVESTYRLVNYGNDDMEFVVLADYNASDFTLRLLRLELNDAPAQQALPNPDDKLQLLTPPIPPQESVLLHVTIEPVRVRRLKQYDFRLVAYARSQNPAQPAVRPFTLRPLHRLAETEQPL